MLAHYIETAIKESMEAKFKTIALVYARQATIEGTEIKISEMGFDTGSVNFENSLTGVRLSYDNPNTYPGADYDQLFYYNYFVGRAHITWHPGYFNSTQNFELHLPETQLHKDVFKNAVENSRLIHHWYALEFNRISTFHRSPTDFDNLIQQNQELENLWNKLEKENLIYKDKLLFPMYLFIITGIPYQTNRFYKETSENFNLLWITPNVCITIDENDFFEFLKSSCGQKQLKFEKNI